MYVNSLCLIFFNLQHIKMKFSIVGKLLLPVCNITCDEMWKTVFILCFSPVFRGAGKKQSTATNKLKSRINPVQFIFLVVWNDASCYIFHMKKLTEKKIEQDNSPFVEIINKENVTYTNFHFYYKFESESLMLISFFISEMNSKIFTN